MIGKDLFHKQNSANSSLDLTKHLLGIVYTYCCSCYVSLIGQDQKSHCAYLLPTVILMLSLMKAHRYLEQYLSVVVSILKSF